MKLNALGLLLLLGMTPKAYGHGFMLRHEYATCAQCHVDPSGGSTLTPYGRAQGEVLLRSRYGAQNDEPGKAADFLFGIFKLPEDIHLSGDVRGALSTIGNTSRVFPMQADFTGAITSGNLVVAGSLGLGNQSTQLASLLGSEGQLISRHHWLGYVPDVDRSWLVRAGRMNLPFGLRIPEHIAWARQATGTDTNVHQQHGVSVSYSGTSYRAEVMGIVGNLQLQPRDFREMGYSGMVEFSVSPTWTVGASSLITHAQRDFAFPTLATFRQAHGLMTRWLPTRTLMLSFETDVVWKTVQTQGGIPSLVSLMQIDFEPTQGLHFVGTGESQTILSNSETQFGAWAGVWWFFASHANVRCDFVSRQQGGQLQSFVLAQLHFYL